MKREGFLHSFFNKTQDFFAWVQNTSYIFISKCRNQKKIPQVGFFGGLNTPIFQYSNPSPGLIFQWIVLKKTQPLNMTHTLWLMINIKHLKTRCWLSDFADVQKIISRLFWIFFSSSKKLLALPTCKKKYDKIVYFFQSTEFKTILCNLCFPLFYIKWVKTSWTFGIRQYCSHKICYSPC